MFRFADRNQLIRTVLSNENQNEDHIKDSVDAVVSYCMSSTCRRKSIMDYFDDNSAVECEKGCDNCTKPCVQLKDYSKEAIILCECIKEMQALNPKITIRQLALTFKGSKAKPEVESKGFHNVAHYGAGQNLFKNDTDTITFVHHLILKGVLQEKMQLVCGRSTTPYLTLGSKEKDLRNGQVQVQLNL